MGGDAPKRRVGFGVLCVALACACLAGLWFERDGLRISLFLSGAFAFGASAYAAFFRPENLDRVENELLRSWQQLQSQIVVYAAALLLVMVGAIALLNLSR